TRSPVHLSAKDSARSRSSLFLSRGWQHQWKIFNFCHYGRPGGLGAFHLMVDGVESLSQLARDAGQEIRVRRLAFQNAVAPVFFARRAEMPTRFPQMSG